MTIEIKLYDLYECRSLANRETAQKVTRMIVSNYHPNEDVIIDFDKIEFVSRSFIHELNCDLLDARIMAEYVNVCDDVRMMNSIRISSPCVETLEDLNWWEWPYWQS
jgi:hypothetical protein